MHVLSKPSQKSPKNLLQTGKRGGALGEGLRWGIDASGPDIWVALGVVGQFHRSEVAPT